MRRVRLALDARFDSLETASAHRLRIALACLALGYLLAWIEVPLGLAHALPEEGTRGTLLAAAVTARVLLGLLYACLLWGQAWARWVTVALGLLSFVFVAPMLPGEWQILPLGAIVTALGVLCKLAASLLLVLPQRTKPPSRI
jgi:hypothetical protein